jgi:hypothetical protein
MYRVLRRYSTILIAVQHQIAGSRITLLINMISTMIEQLGEVFEIKKVASLVSAKTVQTAKNTIMVCSSLFTQINAG